MREIDSVAISPTWIPSTVSRFGTGEVRRCALLAGWSRFLRSPSFLAAGLVFFVSCGGERTVSLAADFSTRQLWRYAFAVDVEGAMRESDSTQRLKGSLSGALEGTVADGNTSELKFRVADVAIECDAYDDAEIAHVRRQLQDTRAVLHAGKGELVVDSSSGAALVLAQDWNLFRNLSRVVPVLPSAPVRTGSTWERERSFPLLVRHGDAIGHLYQSFMLDSIYGAGNETRAAISWSFSYRVEPINDTATGLLGDLPGAGKGHGHAVHNVTARLIEMARIEFEVIPRDSDRLAVEWKESVVLRLEE